MPIYNIVLNSLNQASGGTNANASYYYDWSVLQQGKYKMTFSYQGGANNISASRFATIGIDLGQSKTFTTSSTSTTALSSRIVGILSPSFLAVASSLVSNISTNSPVYLNAVPTNNTFSVNVSNPDASAYTDSAGAVNASYILIICLELLTTNRQF